MSERFAVCVYVYIYICMYVCMYVHCSLYGWMDGCLYIYIYTHIHTLLANYSYVLGQLPAADPKLRGVASEPGMHPNKEQEFSYPPLGCC